MLTALIALGIFASIVLLTEGLYYSFTALSNPEGQRIQERTQKWTTNPPNQVGPRELARKEVLSEIPWFDALLKRFRRVDTLRRLHEGAPGQHSLGAHILLSLLLGITGFVLGRVLLNAHVLAPAIAAAAGTTLPWLSLAWTRRRRLSEIQRQLPDALELISRALRAGHAFSVGLQMVGDEMADPIGAEFKRAFNEITMGVSAEQALRNLANRADLLDVKFFVTSVNIQRETGGNLAEILDALARMIRGRFHVMMKIRSLSAEARTSAIILFCLPFAMAPLINYISPGYLHSLVADPFGRKMLTVAAILMVIGMFVTRKMVAMRV